MSVRRWRANMLRQYNSWSKSPVSIISSRVLFIVKSVERSLATGPLLSPSFHSDTNVMSAITSLPSFWLAVSATIAHRTGSDESSVVSLTVGATGSLSHGSRQWRAVMSIESSVRNAVPMVVWLSAENECDCNRTVSPSLMATSHTESACIFSTDSLTLSAKESSIIWAFALRIMAKSTAKRMTGTATSSAIVHRGMLVFITKPCELYMSS